MVESCELLSHLANIGDVRSLILHPASTTHRQLNEAQLAAAGAGPEVVRLSIGLETVDDIIADPDQAHAAAAAARGLLIRRPSGWRERAGGGQEAGRQREAGVRVGKVGREKSSIRD